MTSERSKRRDFLSLIFIAKTKQNKTKTSPYATGTFSFGYNLQDTVIRCNLVITLCLLIYIIEIQSSFL